jgi:hypothetical protein
MRTRSPIRSILSCLAVGSVACAALACNRTDSTTSDTTGAAPAASSKALGKLEKALQSAVASGAVPAQAATAGPPPDGIMDPARAQSELAEGQPPKVTVGAQGAMPQVVLGRGAWPTTTTAKLTVEMEVGPGQSLPPIEVGFSLQADKPKGEGAAAVQSVVAKITSVTLKAAGLPPDVAKQLSALAGSRVKFSATAEGGGYGFTGELGTGAGPELRDLLDAVTDGLATATIATPREPMGTGGVWMAVSRERVVGIPFIAYRMVKVVRVGDKDVDLEFTTRRYAVGRDVNGASLGSQEPLSLTEMTSTAQGTTTIALGSAIPSVVLADASLRARLSSPGSPDPRTLQAGSRYNFSCP